MESGSTPENLEKNKEYAHLYAYSSFTFYLRCKFAITNRLEVIV